MAIGGVLFDIDALTGFATAVADASIADCAPSVLFIITDSPAKPMIFQDREPLSSLQTTADTPQAALLKEYEYWADCRFGVACAAWFSAVHVTITDTPTYEELDTQLTAICDQFRTFTLPKGSDADDAIYVHEGWTPNATNLTLLCNMKLAQRLDKMRTSDLIAAGTTGATITNQYANAFSLIPTSALGA